MSRTDLAAQILAPLQPKSLLDVGCRDAALADAFPGADYSGADLCPDSRGLVKYVGDVMDITFDRTFDTVVALDILEHLEHPSLFFDRLVTLAQNHVLVSLPNTYDLKSRTAFAFGGLGGKYLFAEEEPVDRHRWLMNRKQILEFYEAKAKKHRLSYRTVDLTYGSSGNRTLVARGGRLLASILPRTLSAQTVFGLFSLG